MRRSPHWRNDATTLIELARASLNHRRTDRHTLQATTEFAHEILASGRDRVVDAAIAHAPSTNVAQAIRRAAETASERPLGSAHGKEIRPALFVIPLLLEFPSDIPATQIDIAVAPVMYSMDLARSLASCLPDPANTTLLTHVCDLSQLSNLPLSVVRQGAIALVAESQGRPHPFIAGEQPRTRSSLFLRYIVGQQLTTTTEPLPRQAQFSCADLCGLIARTVHNTLGVSCDVAAFYGGGFHQPLYTAMWLYQTRRLRLIAASEFAAAGRLNRVAALITQHGTPSTFRLEVRFCSNGIDRSPARDASLPTT